VGGVNAMRDMQIVDDLLMKHFSSIAKSGFSLVPEYDYDRDPSLKLHIKSAQAKTVSAVQEEARKMGLDKIDQVEFALTPEGFSLKGGTPDLLYARLRPVMEGGLRTRPEMAALRDEKKRWAVQDALYKKLENEKLEYVVMTFDEIGGLKAIFYISVTEDPDAPYDELTFARMTKKALDALLKKAKDWQNKKSDVTIELAGNQVILKAPDYDALLHWATG